MTRADLRYRGRFSQRAPSKGARLRVRTPRDFLPYVKATASLLVALLAAAVYF